MGGPLKVRQIERALVLKGMQQRESPHQRMFEKSYPGGPKLVTRISRGMKEYPDSLLAEVAKQLALETVAEVRELVQCTLTERDWDEKVAQRCPDGVNPHVRFRA